MTVSPKVNFEELARSTDEFNGYVLEEFGTYEFELISRPVVPN
jgi:hypothetical protein